MFKKYLQLLGYEKKPSDLAKQAIFQDNIRALKTISILSIITASFLLFYSFISTAYGLPVYRLYCILTIVISTIMLRFSIYTSKNPISSLLYNIVLFLFMTWLTHFSTQATIVDILNHGGFFIFLIMQVLNFNVLMIPPFVSVPLCLLYNIQFVLTMLQYGTYEQIKYVELFIFYLAIITVNIVHYNNVMEKVRKQESVLKSNSDLLQISTTDPLTDVKNRAALRDDYKQIPKSYLIVMICDIDHFKGFNDTYGHANGDLALQSYAMALKKQFGREHVYRYGGDEFLVVMPARKSENIEHEFKEATNIFSQDEALPAHPTGSAGYVYGWCDNIEVLRSMVIEADQFLYMSKKSGRNQIHGDKFSQDHHS